MCVRMCVCRLAAPDQCKLELVGDLSHFTKQAEMVSHSNGMCAQMGIVRGQHTSSHHLIFHCPPQLFHHVPTTNVCMFVSQAKKKKQTKKPVIRPLGTQAVTQQKVRERKPIASDKTIKEVRMNHTFDQCDYPIGSPLSGSSRCMCVCVCTCSSC